MRLVLKPAVNAVTADTQACGVYGCLVRELTRQKMNIADVTAAAASGRTTT